MLYYLVFKEKHLRCENSPYLVFIIVRGITASWIPLITHCYSPFYSDLYSFEEISLCLNFNRIIPLASVMLLHFFLNLYVWFILILVLVYMLLGNDLGMLWWLMFWILQALLICKDNLFNTYLMCDRLAIIYVCFVYSNMLCASVPSEIGHCCICLFLLAKTLFIFD